MAFFEDKCYIDVGDKFEKFLKIIQNDDFGDNDQQHNLRYIFGDR